jgi:hypothetical protein
VAKCKTLRKGREIGIEAKFTTKLSGFNYFLTAANVFFVIAHLVITHSKSKLRYLDIYAASLLDTKAEIDYVCFLGLTRIIKTVYF